MFPPTVHMNLPVRAMMMEQDWRMATQEEGRRDFRKISTKRKEGETEGENGKRKKGEKRKGWEGDKKK